MVEQVASASAGLLFSTACHLALLLAVGGVWEAFLYGVRSVSFAGTECTLIKRAAGTKSGGTRWLRCLCEGPGEAGDLV